ncbi:MAG: hypothetical protein AB7U26_01790 [Sulfuricurvum sp.]
MSADSNNIYFFDAAAALNEAKKRNRIKTSNPHIDALQICYYDGAPIADAPENCICVPLEKVYDYFLTTRNRFPEEISFGGKEFPDTVKQQLISGMQQVMQAVNQERKKQYDALVRETRALRPDFSEGLRVFFLTSRETAVMQHVSKNIADALSKLGCQVCVSIEANEMEYLHGVHHLVEYLNFRPNVTFNINHLNNGHLHDEVFNFIWFQDPMASIKDPSPVNLRKRDTVYSLVGMIDTLLEAKGIPFSRQSFCINQSLFHTDDTVHRERKIVFIGSSYAHFIDANVMNSGIVQEAVKLLDRGEAFIPKTIAKFAKKYALDTQYLHNTFIPFIVRDVTVLWLHNVHEQTGIPVEIYGQGWEQYESLRPYCKGPLPYDRVADAYNRAEYTLVPHSLYVLQQRTLEAAACGCRPIVYDCRYNDTPPYYEEALEYFRTVGDIVRIIRQNQSKELNRLVDENSYEHLARRIVQSVESALSQPTDARD